VKFNNTIKNSLPSFGLKRIRLKCDPLNREHDQYKAYSSYEGYVLEENDKTISVFIVNAPEELDPFVKLPQNMIQKDDKLAGIKEHLIASIEGEAMGVAVRMIGQLNDLTSIEAILKDNGLTDRDLKEIYREYILK
jgi:hypothetical protein